MALRKCPGCKNTISAETETCPICGCNPRTCRLRRIFFWTTVSAVTLTLVGVRVRQHAGGIGAVGPASGAVAGAGR